MKKPSNKIAIAGASGFVGKYLIEHLKDQYEIRALSRSHRKSEDGTEWVQADLYSMLDCEQALNGCETAIYLVHSMLPSAALVQGSFEDYDLVLADNFARAAAKVGVKKIIYLGGIIPEDEKLSAHLESRLEVENILASVGVTVISLRAGLIIGPGGSSFRVMRNLVERLPLMLCPSWTQTNSNPIYVDDVVKIIAHTLENNWGEKRVIDIGGADQLSYIEMMSGLARALGKKRYFLGVPLFSPGLSKFWVSMVTGAPRNLIYPLVESLKSSMVPSEGRVFKGFSCIGFQEMIQRTIAIEDKKQLPSAFVSSKSVPPDEVRSLQRFSTPKKTNATAIACRYFSWLPRFLFPFIKVVSRGEKTLFCFWGIRTPLLVLRFSEERSTPDRQLFYIEESLLARESERGRLEFRDTSDGYTTLAAIHEFKPRLPWFIYKYTQALLHLWVMNSFRKEVERNF